MLESVCNKIFLKSLGTVAINMKPVRGPWGGSSVFVHQFSSALQQHGFKVRFDLRAKVDIILIVDPRVDLMSKAFGMDEIKSYKQKNPAVKIIHRINECDKRKGSNFIDELLCDANDIVDHTVFISQWLKEYFQKSWFPSTRPHSVIYNGADARVFHPIGGSPFKKGEPLRIVTHHWSDNPMKGFPVYQQLDEMINSGDIKDVELWIVGRWPANIRWKSAKLFAPEAGTKLADILRKCHLYITASLWEPCGMHHVEGTQCGLPLLAHADGGGIVEAAEKYGIVFRDDLREVIINARQNYSGLRQQVFDKMPNGFVMACEYVRIVQMLLAGVK